MNSYRKLLVLGLNELVNRNLISLEKTGKDGHVLADLAGIPSAIMWSEIGHEELRISVWWNYDHSKHPQANLTGNQRENFTTTLPLASNSSFKKFVGITVSGWLERREAIHLQGHGRDGLFDIYTRRGQLVNAESIAKPVAKGFDVEGKLY